MPGYVLDFPCSDATLECGNGVNILIAFCVIQWVQNAVCLVSLSMSQLDGPNCSTHI